jgi:hypothetical protein
MKKMDISGLKVISREQEKYIIGRASFDDEQWGQIADELDDWVKSSQREEMARREAGLKGLLTQWTREDKPTLVFGEYLEVLGLGDEAGNIILPIQ